MVVGLIGLPASLSWLEVDITDSQANVHGEWKFTRKRCGGGHLRRRGCIGGSGELGAGAGIVSVVCM